MRRLTTSKGYLEINFKNRTLEFRAWRDTETMKLEITSTCSAFKKYLNDFIYLTIIPRNRAEYRLILSRRGRRPSRLKSDDIPRD